MTGERDQRDDESGTLGDGARASCSTAKLPGGQDPVDPSALEGWDRYAIEAPLGSGGMGQVFRAFDPRIRRPVAIKFLTRRGSDDTRRFVLEAHAQARVEHDNVCRVYEVGEHASHPYIAMQLIEGATLKAAAPSMSTQEKVAVIRTVAEAVHAAHRNGLIHRDLKPGNIMVERSESGWKPFVLDFGLVRDESQPGLTLSGAVLGTPTYMAPEQALGYHERVDRRTDVYSLGVVLYEMLVGRPPFEGKTSLDIFSRVVSSEPLPPRARIPDLPRDLEAIVLKCLEKSPVRRYDSARALAEDLQRHLDGEPVLARHPGRLGRWLRVLSRNRLAAAIVAASLLVVLGTAGSSIAALQRARRRAAVLQRFSQQATELEAVVRFAALLPRHDTTRERTIVRERMRSIEGEMSRLGRLAAGPGDYALGRAHLALGDLDEARDHLDRAVTSGIDGADVEFALGLTHVMLLQRELDSLVGVRSKSARDVRLKEIEASHRAPALAALAAAQGSTAAPLAEGVLALVERRYQDAITCARAAEQAVPWLYEARRLVADTLVAQAESRREEGDPGAAITTYQQADAEYSAVLRAAESDAASHEGRCRAWTAVLELRLWGPGGDLEGPYRTAVEACGDALAVEPERVSALVKLSQAHRLWGAHLFAEGRDASPVVAAAEVAARRAAALDPGDALAPSVLGSALRLRAGLISGAGGDPRSVLNEAISAFQRAVDLEPGLATPHTNMGSAYSDLAEYEKSHGLDPTAALEHARHALERSVEIDPGFVFAHVVLGVVCLDEAEVLSAGAGDPSDRLAEAIDSLNAAVRLQPDSNVALINLGVALFEKGAHEMATGRDPMATLERGQSVLARALEVNPRFAATHVNLGNIHFTKAEYLNARHRDPAFELELARGSYRRALEVNPRSLTSLRNLAECDNLLATAELRAGRSPEGTLIRARDHAGKAIALNPSYSNAWLSLATAHRLDAARLAAGGKDPGRAVGEAIAAADRALEVDGRSAGARAERARAHLVLARWLAGHGGDPESALRSALADATSARAVDSRSSSLRALLGEIRLRRAESLLARGLPYRDEVAAGLQECEQAIAINDSLDARSTVERLRRVGAGRASGDHAAPGRYDRG